MLPTTGDSLGQRGLEERWLSFLGLADSPSRKHYHIPSGLTPTAGLAACWSLRILEATGDQTLTHRQHAWPSLSTVAGCAL